MPRGKGKEVERQGVNHNGNEFTVYDDGSYRYKNVDHETGKTKSNFYDTAQGHAFYRSNGPDGYNFHENYRQGFRDYSSNQKPVAEGVNAHGNEFKFYENGSYRYNNKDAETGKTSSNFYNDGRGNAHYRKSEPDSYSYHENTFDGSRNYRGGNSSRHH